MVNIGILKVITAVIQERGFVWLTNRLRYSAKLKLLNKFPFTEKYFEEKAAYPKRTDVFQINVAELKKFIQKLDKQDLVALVNVADCCIKGVIEGFSSIKLNYGKSIDWQLNPLTKKRCDATKKWFQIPDFDAERGDIKITWEASRFSFFITLARAYLLTGEKKYYVAFSQQLDNWLQANPYSYGANFKCGQECSIRMVNALLAFTVFKSCAITSEKDESNIKDLIDRCYRKVLSNFFYAYKCIKNNHTVSELMGMIVGAWCCEDESQLKKAFQLLDEVIDEQFTEDGGYCQSSFNYQRLTLQDLECILSIESIVKKTLSNRSKEKIKNAALLMYQCQDKTSDMPNYGSNDGALVFPVSSCGYRDFNPVINTTYALITGNQLYNNGKHQEELIWFSPSKSIAEYPAIDIEQKSCQFKDAGLFTLRTKNAWALIVSKDCRKFGIGHMDQLHFDLWIDGSNVFCDGGSYSYASELGKKLGKAISHNTAVVNGKEQLNTYGHFMSYGRPERKLGTCNDEMFEGTMISKNGYTHTRKIIQKENSYLIIDTIENARNYQILFHTPCSVICKGNIATLFHKEKPICSIKCNGLLEVCKAQRSLYYLQEEEINCIAISNVINADGEKNILTEILLTEKE